MFPARLQTSDGLSLRTHSFRSATGSARAGVLFVHGLGDHGQALPYRCLAEALAPCGFGVYGFDLRGHGQSDGRRLYVNAWRDFLGDLRLVLEQVQRADSDRPVFLIGLSLGGLLALNYAQHHPAGLKGVVAVAPAVDASGVPALMRALIPLIARVAPRLSLDLGLDLTRISRDAAAARAYADDPLLTLGKSTPRMAAEVLAAIAETQAGAASLCLPLLILHGAEDKIVPPSGSAEFFQKAGALDKQRRVYAGAYHNLFLEANRAQVFGDIVTWMESHL
jgi:alpha-beta hydrolase superfamily lysophospholipase